ncbi:hypothetical protein WJX73_008478 [Symbiochloris irregularis]|uniref:Complex 1 LYR protein domain-containing protein n=1 Tax=Symbiochloris irregularis TaxID=706552 RepID=A0AAW1P3E5_9CHLO
MQVDKSAFTVVKLYRDCLKLADYIGAKEGTNSKQLRSHVRQQFKRNLSETDPKKIEEQKDAAIRGLSNYMFHEASRMAKEQQPKAPQ